MTRRQVTVGVDIGTSSVKAIAADADGEVVASVRVPHPVRVPSPGRFEHDAELAWRRGPREALAAVSTDLDVQGVSVAAMVPSLTAVDGDGLPLSSGCIDALADQIVAGADNDGDVLVILGTTLIIWAVTTSEEPVPGYWTIPHTAPGKLLVGGPSNAGGLFTNWVANWL